MATIILNCTSGNGADAFKNNSQIRLTYTASDGTFTLTKIEGIRNDGYRTWNQAYTSMQVTVAGTTKTVTLSHYWDFDTSWTDFGFPTTSWTGISAGSFSVSIYCPYSEGNMAYATYTSSITMSYQTFTNRNMNIFIGDDGKARMIKEIYIGNSSNKAQAIRQVYIGDSNGEAKLCYCKHSYNSSHTCIYCGHSLYAPRIAVTVNSSEIIVNIYNPNDMQLDYSCQCEWDIPEDWDVQTGSLSAYGSTELIFDWYCVEEYSSATVSALFKVMPNVITEITVKGDYVDETTDETTS